MCIVYYVLCCVCIVGLHVYGIYNGKRNALALVVGRWMVAINDNRGSSGAAAFSISVWNMFACRLYPYTYTYMYNVWVHVVHVYM